MYEKFAYLADRRDHVVTCATWAFDTWGKYNASFTLEKRIERFTEHCNMDKIPLTVLAFNDENIPVGMSSLRENDGIRPDLGPWLGSVFVDPQYRHQGIGANLVKQIHGIAQRLGYESIYLLTYEVSLPDWYAKLGWENIGTDFCHNNPVTVMQLKLGP